MFKHEFFGKFRKGQVYKYIVEASHGTVYYYIVKLCKNRQYMIVWEKVGTWKWQKCKMHPHYLAKRVIIVNNIEAEIVKANLEESGAQL